MSIDRRSGGAFRLAVLAMLALFAVACRQGMFDQARYEPLEASELFADGAAARPLPAHTVARGHLRADQALVTGIAGESGYAMEFPMTVDRPFIERGRERYDIFCAPCHGRTGQGDGMIVRRGYPQPPSLHELRLRLLPVGYIVNVITQGFGRMPSYASQVSPEERWAVAAYVRALQLAGNAPLTELGAEDEARLLALPELAEPTPGTADGGLPGAASESTPAGPATSEEP